VGEESKNVYKESFDPPEDKLDCTLSAYNLDCTVQDPEYFGYHILTLEATNTIVTWNVDFPIFIVPRDYNPQSRLTYVATLMLIAHQILIVRYTVQEEL